MLFRRAQNCSTAIAFVVFQACSLLKSLQISFSTVVINAPSSAGHSLLIACRSFITGPFSKNANPDNEIAVAFPRIAELEISGMSRELLWRTCFR
jgi:hypothetical protein